MTASYHQHVPKSELREFVLAGRMQLNFCVQQNVGCAAAVVVTGHVLGRCFNLTWKGHNSFCWCFF